MTPIKATIDTQTFTKKPSGAEIARISTRIAKNSTDLDTPENIYSLAYNVGVKGQTFCPATFSNGKRCKENFEQQQLFALDFDNKDKENSVTFQDIKSRAEHYELPVLFAYETFSSTQHDKFRVVFMNDVPITDRPVAEAMQYALSVIFPEADKSCTNDVSKMYFGGNHKDSLYFDHSIPKINIDSLFRHMTFYVRKDKGDKHYKEKLRRISSTTGIALNNSGLPDITITDKQSDAAHLTEQASGASTIDVKNGGTSPTPIIYINI